MQDIDTGCRLGLNHPMGPITLADFFGLDTCLEIIRVLHNGTGDPKFRPAPLLVQYVEAGWVGKKAGRGFYDWTGPEPGPQRGDFSGARRRSSDEETENTGISNRALRVLGSVLFGVGQGAGRGKEE